MNSQRNSVPSDCDEPFSEHLLYKPTTKAIDPSMKKRKKPGRYNEALKHLLPIRRTPKEKQYLPSHKAGLFNYITMHWLTKLMWKAYRKGLTKDDFWQLWPVDQSETNAERLERMWRQECSKKGPENSSLSRVVLRFTSTRHIVAGIAITFAMLFQFIGPSLILKMILNYIEDPSLSLQYGLSLVSFLMLSQSLRTYTWTTMWVIGCHTALRVQGAIQYLIYQKLLRIRGSGEKVMSQVVTLSTTDQDRIFEAMTGGVIVLCTPMMFLLSLGYTVYILGYWALIGNVIIVLFYPMMAALGRFSSILRVRTVKQTTKRVGLMGEILNSIRLIKMYAWEESFAKKIQSVRAAERVPLQQAAFMSSMSSTIAPSITIIASVLTFIAYSLDGNTLTASDAFTIFSVFSSTQFTLGTLPLAIKQIAEANVCLTRVQQFLSLPEVEPKKTEMNHSDAAVVIKSGTFAWEMADISYGKTKKEATKPPKKVHAANGTSNGTLPSENVKLIGENEEKAVECLFDINLEVKRGKLVGICGRVGSGKSSLFSAITGDMKRTSGDVDIYGKPAIVSQQAWIFNDTVRENILFGLPMDGKRYEMVLDVCSLRRDMTLLTNGDMTEIGDKGTNLSGGQKQRINLARAVYSNRDIYLLDDPLSAVDSKVAKSIFQKCILGALKGKTVLFVTHGLHFLKQCDEIVFMDEGSIKDCRDCHELTKMQGDGFKLEQASEEEGGEGDESNEEPPNDAEHVKLVQDEGLESSITGFTAYKKYMGYCGGCCVSTLVASTFIFFILSQLFIALWLQIWLDQGDGQESERRENMTEYNTTFSEVELKGYVTNNPDMSFYLTVYGCSVLVMLALGAVKGYGLTKIILSGSSKMHDRMFRKVMASPLAFFDTTPMGRILNRFSKDIDELDVRMPYLLELVFQCILFILCQLIMVCVIFPLFLIAIGVIIGVYVFMDILLNKGVRECKKWENLLRSNVVQDITSTIAGLSIIRTYERERSFNQKFSKTLNNHLASLIVFHFANRWFTFRMDTVGLVIVFSTALISVLSKGDSSASEAGLALSLVFGVIFMMPFTMRMKSELNARFTSVERVMEYAETLESEAAAYVPEKKPQADWPRNGAIDMTGLKLRYRKDLPLVLHGLDATISGAEKIGIVGRTGAGKTSLISTLLRLSELDEGTIVIDGVKIGEIGLHDLRSAIAVIPQDPVLFQGSIRYNLDPFDEHPDDVLWEALEKSYLKDRIGREKAQLHTAVEADGENFSVGEKQLICLARAIIRKNKILLLDEATASVDMHTDALVQNTIKQAFADCTVLTIAHRLNTVVGYDRIMVMDAGKIVEFDTPQNLMNTPKSVFSDMMQAMGVTSLEQMKKTSIA